LAKVRAPRPLDRFLVALAAGEGHNPVAVYLAVPELALVAIAVGEG
jgi:hypothetical protein